MSPLNLKPATTALVLIDLQRGIVGMPLQPRPGAAVVANAVRLRDAVRRAGGTVFLVHVDFLDDKDRLVPITDEPAGGASPAPGWSNFVPEISPQPGDITILKRQWGAFYGTELECQLRRRKIDTIILGGIATPMGVESTARDAYERGFQQVFVEDAMAARTEAVHRHVVENIFPRLGRLRSTDAIVAELA